MFSLNYLFAMCISTNIYLIMCVYIDLAGDKLDFIECWFLSFSTYIDQVECRIDIHLDNKHICMLFYNAVTTSKNVISYIIKKNLFYFTNLFYFRFIKQF